MTRYIFSGGKVRVEEGISLTLEKPSHPLGMTVLLIVPRSGEYNSDQITHKPPQEMQHDEPASRDSTRQ